MLAHPHEAFQSQFYIPFLTFVQIIGENDIERQLLKAPLAVACSPFPIPPQTPESEMCETGTNGQTTITGRIPDSFGTVMWVL